MANEGVGLVVNAAKAALTMPFRHEPGTYFEYAQITVSLLEVVVERAAGLPFLDFLQQDLLEHVGIPRDHWTWLTDLSGTPIGSGALFMLPPTSATSACSRYGTATGADNS